MSLLKDDYVDNNREMSSNSSSKNTFTSGSSNNEENVRKRNSLSNCNISPIQPDLSADTLHEYKKQKRIKLLDKLLNGEVTEESMSNALTSGVQKYDAELFQAQDNEQKSVANNTQIAGIHSLLSIDGNPWGFEVQASLFDTDYHHLCFDRESTSWIASADTKHVYVNML